MKLHFPEWAARKQSTGRGHFVPAVFFLSRVGGKEKHSVKYKLTLYPHLATPPPTRSSLFHTSQKPKIQYQSQLSLIQSTYFCGDLKHPLIWSQVTMRLSTFATALFAALATTAPAPVAIDKSILDLLRDLPAGGPTLHKRYAYTFLFIDGAIYANPTDPNLLAKVTNRCYVPAQDLLLLFTNGQQCTGPLVPVAAWFFGMSIEGGFFLVQPLFFCWWTPIADDILSWRVDRSTWKSLLAGEQRGGSWKPIESWHIHTWSMEAWAYELIWS